MKPLIILALLLLAISAQAQTSDITISWNPPASQFTVVKHTLYRVLTTGGSAVTNKLGDIPMPALSTVLTNVGAGNYTFVVTSSNQWGESPASSPVSTPAGIPPAPNGVSVAITIKVP